MMKSLEKLKNTSSIQDFAPLLGFEAKKLTYLLYKCPQNEKYTQFSIAKKNGGARIINAPIKDLKRAQRRLANILNDSIEEIENKNQPLKRPVSHGFKKKLEIISNNQEKEYISLGIHTNARYHRNKRYVLNLDLADFFPSFNFGRVRGFFIKNNNFNLDPKIAALIAQIACNKNELPQGSPCSPVITNLITHILDVRLIQWAKKHSCNYSRYADDITFSTNKKTLSNKLAIESKKPNQWLVGNETKNIIERCGFKINPSKTRLQFRPSRQVVTGLIVNKKVNVKSEYYRYARSMCHSLFTKGTFFLPKDKDKDKLAKKLKQLEGILSHIYFIKEFSRTSEEIANHKLLLEIAKKDKKYYKRDSVTELYSKFLYFRYFVASKRPLILCEGKTDAIYLKTAIKNLDFSFPKVNFFPFSRQAREVMRIHNGASALKNFIEHYDKSTTFIKQTSEHPVIVLLDNDNDASKVINMLKEKYNNNKTVYDRMENYIYPVIKNLYVVLLPMDKGKDNKIEDFFDQSVLDTKLNGKTFSAENGEKFDKNKHYSKQVLATQVIKKEQDKINFAKFKCILKLLSEAIKSYDTK